HALPDQRPRGAVATGRPDEKSGPVSPRQSVVRRPDDAARHPGRTVCPPAGAAVRGRRREDLRRVRQAVLAVRAVRECERDRSRRHARPKVGAVGRRGDSGPSPAGGAAMRAIQIEAYGNPAEVAKLVDVPDVGTPAAGEVVIEVEASPINQYDLLLIAGGYGYRPRLPAIMGTEGVGRVVALGAGVKHLKEGDRTLVPFLHPAWAERVKTDAPW